MMDAREFCTVGGAVMLALLLESNQGQTIYSMYSLLGFINYN